MKKPHLVAALGAAVLLPLTVAVPAAHADQTFTGEVTGSDPSAVFYEPHIDSDTCGGPGDDTQSFHYDAVTFTSTTDGPRRFEVTGAAPAYVLEVYRNNICVAADYQPDDAVELQQKVTDVDGVLIAKGDQVTVRIAGPAGGPWTLNVQQAGSANSAATGKAARYIALPEQVLCANGTALATLTKKARKAARAGKITSIVFRANGQKVAKVKGAKVRKAARKGVVLTGIPRQAVTIDVVVKVRDARKKRASRPYSAC